MYTQFSYCKEFSYYTALGQHIFSFYIIHSLAKQSLANINGMGLFMQRFMWTVVERVIMKNKQCWRKLSSKYLFILGYAIAVRTSHMLMLSDHQRDSQLQYQYSFILVTEHYQHSEPIRHYSGGL